MKKDGLAVEAEGVLVQRRPVSPIIVVPSQTQKRWGWGSTGLIGVVIPVNSQPCTHQESTILCKREKPRVSPTTLFSFRPLLTQLSKHQEFKG